MITLGVDLGTSGVRAVALDGGDRVLAAAAVALPTPVRDGASVRQEPSLWWDAVCAVLARVAAELRARRAVPLALAVDGTSATLLLADAEARSGGTPLAPARMYNDAFATDAAARIAAVAPDASPARGPGSSLAKLLALAAETRPRGPVYALHQADWISARLRGAFRSGPTAAAPALATDWNNALKLGFDPVALGWPGWVRALLAADAGNVRLPRAHAPGADLGPIDPAVAAALGLPTGLRIRAGTTDSTAAVLAAGLGEPGDALTCLGSTLVLKVVARRPVNAPDHGVYSHRFGSRWLVGGASNSGGAVLRAHFTDAQLERLSTGIDPTRPSGLDYYPLPAPGERFPVADPTLAPRLAPRPADDVAFLHGLLEGIARIERDGYRLLESLGAPAPRRVLTSGGGAANPQWMRLRALLLDRPVERAALQDAASGAARLARGPLD